MGLYFSRHTKVFMKQGTKYWEIPVLDGFSFSQSVNSSEVTLNEMEATAGNSRRGKMMFNDSYAPAEWSFSTYIRPFVAVPAASNGWEPTLANHHAVEEALWANFVAPYSAANTYTTSWPIPTGGTASPITTSTTKLDIDFTESNRSTLGTFELWFVLGACSGDTPLYYKIPDCVIGSASIDFEIDGIATAAWSGNGGTISEEIAPAWLSSVNDEAVSSTSNFIRNRLTTLAVQAGDDAAQIAGGTAGAYTLFPGASNNGVYNIILTGGNISFENNITFLTPETLCTINSPIGHVTGSRSISGSFTCYLSTTQGESGDLWEDLSSAIGVVTNSFNLVFTVGGAAAPNVSVTLPQCHLETPSHSLDDVVAVEVSFTALPSSLDVADEASISYKGVAY